MKQNSFDECNRGRCFNYTIQLAAKALLRPFTSCLRSDYDAVDDVDDITPDLEDVDDDEHLDAEEDTEEIENDDDDEVDELDALENDEKAKFLEETVRGLPPRPPPLPYNSSHHPLAPDTPSKPFEHLRTPSRTSAPLREVS